jgi:hypothetical protein
VDASQLPELAAGGGLLALVASAAVRVLQGDRDWSRLIDAERSARRESDERADEEEARRRALEEQLRVALRRTDELEADLRAARARLKAYRRGQAAA